jgi:hypothetical protein
MLNSKIISKFEEKIFGMIIRCINILFYFFEIIKNKNKLLIVSKKKQIIKDSIKKNENEPENSINCLK